jgi:23S rRNA (cytidine1920-2'-O)/16S rRNA (cytidine1409-2'-O)-methyltransferase
MKKTRLDVLLTERGLSESRERAKAEIMSGVVFVNGQRADKPGSAYPDDCAIELRGEKLKDVSRGGYKLERALDYFDLSPSGCVCIDCGASTGGFTDCLLQRGAAAVYSVDVGYGQLAWKLRTDPRVTSIERTNARFISREIITREPSFAVVDVSFISLSLVLPPVFGVLARDAVGVCLIKPQFEAGREKVGKNGVVREPDTHEEVLRDFIINAQSAGFAVRGVTHSPIKGPQGNIEFLGYIAMSDGRDIDIPGIVKAAHEELA